MQETYYIKFTGKGNIPNPLQDGNSYKVEGEFGIEGTLRTPNHDGTFTTNYIAKPIMVEIVNDKGARIRIKDPRKNSQKIRLALWKEYFNEGYTEDFETIYNEATWIICRMAPEIIKEVISRIDEKVTR